MIEVLIVDDHPAVRAGLVALLRLEPGLVPIAAVSNGADAIASARSRRPTVALVDYHLPDADGLSVCREIRTLPDPPAVVIYSAFADDLLALPAALVGAHAVISKSLPSDGLFEVLRSAAQGRHSLLKDPRLLASAQRSVSVEDMPVLGMLADETPLDEIAAVLDLPLEEVERRMERILQSLKREADRGLGLVDLPPPQTAEV